MAEGYRIWLDRISTSYGTQPGKSSFYIKKLFECTLRDPIMHLYKVYQRLIQVKDNEFHLNPPTRLALTPAALKTGYTILLRIV